MSDVIWETFDGLFKTLHRQGRRVEELEARVVELERRLQDVPAALPTRGSANGYGIYLDNRRVGFIARDKPEAEEGYQQTILPSAREQFGTAVKVIWENKNA